MPCPVPDPAPRPSRAALASWLASEAVVDAAGAVRSWSNPAHPGFAYPEAAAWWLAWAGWRRRRGEAAPDGGRIRAVATRLAADLRGGAGIGKDGRVYLFDTCVAARALARTATDPGLGWREERWASDVTRAVDAFLATERPVHPAPPGPVRWSCGWGPHLLRAAALLEEAAGLVAEPGWHDRARRLRARLSGAADPGPRGYTHAHLYAVEGRWRSPGSDDAGVDDGLALVASAQREDGALPAWLDGGGPARADATAQAARLWLARGGPDDRAAAERALAWLARLQAAEGAIPYEAGSRDANTWATLFTDQAAAWSTSVDPSEGWI